MRAIFGYCFLLLFSHCAQAIEITPAAGFRLLSMEILESDITELSRAQQAGEWREVPLFKIPSSHRRLWIRLTTEHLNEQQSGLYISLLGSYELYHQNHLIHRSGLTGNAKQKEQPGNIDNYISLPESTQQKVQQTWYLKISRDNLSMRYPNASLDFTQNGIGQLLSQRYQQSLIPLVSLTAFFTIALYYFCLWYGQRYPTYRLFSLLCLVLALWLLAENWRPLFSYPYHWHIPRMWFISSCAALFALLLPMTLLKEFRLYWHPCLAGLQMALFVTLHALVPQFDLVVGIFVLQSFVLAILISGYAVIKAQPGSLPICMALLVCGSAMLPNPNKYLEQWFFLLFPLVIFALLYRQSLSIKQLRQSRDRALISSENAKLQLLKKTIQPHFLLNTLTSLSEWIEQAPDTALAMVEQLAEEFYLLSTMVDKSLVPLQDELALCRIHLQLMSLRNHCDFELQANVSDMNLAIPPGILHTLLENCFSHNRFQQGHYTFYLTQSSQDEQQHVLTFNTPHFETTQEKSSALSTGLGTRYLEIRLQQSFPDNWNINQEKIPNQWQTRIHIKA